MEKLEFIIIYLNSQKILSCFITLSALDDLDRNTSFGNKAILETVWFSTCRLECSDSTQVSGNISNWKIGMSTTCQMEILGEIDWVVKT